MFGKPIAVIPVSPEALAQGIAAAGIPSIFVPLLVAFDVNTAAGNVSAVSGDFKKLTGCAPLLLREFLVENRPLS